MKIKSIVIIGIALAMVALINVSCVNCNGNSNSVSSGGKCTLSCECKGDKIQCIENTCTYYNPSGL